MVTILVMLVVSPLGQAQAAGATPIMGPTVVTADDLANWYATTGMTPHPDLPVSIRTLARYFIEEGRAEGVRGDIAFAQSIVETGYFTFPTSGQVRPEHNNYGGIGAVDGGSSPNSFPTPRIGVRAQIQHLRAYADPTVTSNNLANPLVDPRFDLVQPKGKAPNWEDLSGTWASDTQYAQKILNIFGRILVNSPPRPGAIPVTGDWNGDGVTDLGWFHEGQWVLWRADGTRIAFTYGMRPGDVPVTGDWNGDGRDGVGIFRPSAGGEWHLRNGFSGRTDHIFVYGQRAGDVPVTGDWNNSGRDGVGIYRPSTGGEWHLRNGFSGRTNHVFVYGRRTGDRPVTGDWNGDGRDGVGIYRAGGEWHLRNRFSGATSHVFVYGKKAGDVPVTGDWNGRADGSVRDGVGIFRPSTAEWHLRNGFSGRTDAVFRF